MSRRTRASLLAAVAARSSTLAAYISELDRSAVVCAWIKRRLSAVFALPSLSPSSLPSLPRLISPPIVRRLAPHIPSSFSAARHDEVKCSMMSTMENAVLTILFLPMEHGLENTLITVIAGRFCFVFYVIYTVFLHHRHQLTKKKFCPPLVRNGSYTKFVPTPILVLHFVLLLSYRDGYHFLLLCTPFWFLGRRQYKQWIPVRSDVISFVHKTIFTESKEGGLLIVPAFIVPGSN